VSIPIRQVGDWTQALGERVGATPAVVKSLTQAAMKAFEKDDKSGMMQEGRGDFVELDPNASTRPLPVVGIDGPHSAPAEDVSNPKLLSLSVLVLVSLPSPLSSNTSGTGRSMIPSVPSVASNASGFSAMLPRLDGSRACSRRLRLRRRSNPIDPPATQTIYQ
jgi:hypothetical protein